jgi:CARDB
MNIIFQYAAKFVCGKSNGEVVAPGEYWTAINVHNPTNSHVRFRKKIAIGLPSERSYPASRFYEAKLGPDETLEIDRKDIFEHSHPPFEFIKGFVVIESDVELDVVAVYTAAGHDQQVQTIHTERVPPRRLKIEFADLIPVPNEAGSFCNIKDNALVVTVRNQGTASAGPSTTEVDFGTFGKVSMLTPSLGPGASVNLSFPIPFGCHDPDCEFRITVDSNNDVTESNEGNNVADDRCLG